MKKNMGKIDRLIRTVLAANILFFYAMGFVTGLTAVLLLIIAGIFLITSFFAVCPLYTLLGIHSNRKKLIRPIP